MLLKGQASPVAAGGTMLNVYTEGEGPNTYVFELELSLPEDAEPIQALQRQIQYVSDLTVELEEESVAFRDDGQSFTPGAEPEGRGLRIIEDLVWNSFPPLLFQL